MPDPTYIPLPPHPRRRTLAAWLRWRVWAWADRMAEEEGGVITSLEEGQARLAKWDREDARRDRWRRFWYSWMTEMEQVDADEEPYYDYRLRLSPRARFLLLALAAVAVCGCGAVIASMMR